MDASSVFTNYRMKTIDIGSSPRIAEAAFYTPSTNTWNNNNNANYSFEVGIHSVAGQSIIPGMPDLQKPSKPTNLRVTNRSANALTITWDASTDNYQVKKYLIYRATGNGTASYLNDTLSTNYSDVGLTYNQTYTYYVVAVDYGDNLSDASATTNAITSNWITIYYKVGFTNPYIHYKLGSTWTSSPVLMSASEFSGYKKAEINMQNYTTIQFAFTDGNGNWDNNGGSGIDYKLSPGTYTYLPGTNNTGRGTIQYDKPNTSKKVMIYYKQGFSTPYIHYHVSGQPWTSSPGVAMSTSSFTGHKEFSVELGTANDMEFVFNNGSGTWDNNNSLNYFRSTGIWTYLPGANNTSPGSWLAGTP